MHPSKPEHILQTQKVLLHDGIRAVRKSSRGNATLYGGSGHSGADGCQLPNYNHVMASMHAVS